MVWGRKSGTGLIFQLVAWLEGESRTLKYRRADNQSNVGTFLCLPLHVKKVFVFLFYQVILAYNNIFYLRTENKFSISFTITLPAVKSARAKSSFCFHITASEDSERTDPPFRI